MDQAYARGHNRARLLEAAAPLLRAFPGDIWLVHRVIPLADGKIDKPPAPGFRTNDPTSWCNLADAIEEALRYSPGTAGVGFAITADMITFDFDACIGPDDEVAAEIAALIQRLGSFSYRTVSGHGMRVICRNKAVGGVPPGKYTRRTEGGHQVEVFVGPCNFYNTFSATGANGHRIERRATLTRALLEEWLGGGGGGGGAAGISTSSNLGEIGRTSDLGKRAHDETALLDALQAIPNDDTVDRGQWAKIGEAVYAATGGSERGREAFLAWSQLWAGYDADNTVKLWDSFDSSPPRVIGAGTVFHLAQQHGWTWPEEPMAFDPTEDSEATPNVEVMPPRLSEAALARRFARRHREQLRFVQKWGECRWWTGTVWQEDTTQEVLNEARLFLQEMAATCTKISQARSLTKVSMARAVLAYAAATSELAATVGQWDADRQFNTPDGVIDPTTR